MKDLVRLFLIVLGATVVGCKGDPPPANLSGSGSSFVWPMMARWVSEFERAEGIKVDYKPRGSSGGIKDLVGKKVDFACSDGPLSDEELAKLKNQGEEVVHVPLILSAVVAVYNLDGFDEPIRFTGSVLADIFAGNIKKWNHQTLRQLNPTVHLPDAEITVVHRSDGSGTTYIWTDYLSKVSTEWKSKVGTDRAVAWPVGVGQDGNEGVADRVRNTPGGIGYVDLADAHRKSLNFGLVQNREKEFVKASLTSVVKAAENMKKRIPDDLRYSLTDASDKGAYPITGTTWAIVYRDQSNNKQARQLVSFLKWVVGDGQLFAEQLLYARLPEDIAERSLIAVERIKVSK